MAGAPVLAGDLLHVTPAEALALWRYHLVVEGLDPRLSGMERGALARRIAGEHTAPSGEPRQLSRKTLDRSIRRCRAEVFAGHRRCRLQTGHLAARERAPHDGPVLRTASYRWSAGSISPPA